MEVRSFTEAEKLNATKSASDQWIIAELLGGIWFSEGHIICRATAAPSGTHVPSPDAWIKGISDRLRELPDGYARASDDGIRGKFEEFGYVRGFLADERAAYVQEKFVRLAGGYDAVWVKSRTSPVYFTADGKIVAVVMPVLDKDGAAPISDWPQIPFLEDEVCFHYCGEGGR